MEDAYLNSVDAEVLGVQRRMAAWARRYPKIAARLRAGADVASDPHVGRLIQAFAVLSARTRCRVDETFAEIIEPLLEETFQTHLRPVPSLAVTQLNPDPDQPPDPEGAVQPRLTELQTEVIDDRLFRFRTCADLQLWPIRLTSVSLEFPPFPSASETVARASCAIRLSLETMAGNIPLQEVLADTLRFYIDEQLDTALRIHEALCCDTLGIQVVTSSGEQMILPPDCIRPVGFDAEERLLPSAGQPEGERLLSELIALPARFLFFELSGLREAFGAIDATAVELNLLIGTPSAQFPARIAENAVRLNCVPVVNLFETTTEPADLDAVQEDVRLAVESRNPGNCRIHEVLKVTVQEEDDTEHEYPAFQSIGLRSVLSTDSRYWTRLPDAEHQAVLRFVDPGGRPAAAAAGSVEAAVVCSNGDGPHQASGEEQLPTLQLVSPGLVSDCRFLSRPTSLLEPVPADLALQLVSRALPHPTATSSPQETAQRLRDILQLLFRDPASLTAGMVRSIESISIRRVTGIHRRCMVCHGLEVEVVLDDERSVSGGMFLFAETLRRLFARYATQNTFVRYQVRTTSGRKYDQWPIIDGERFNV